MSRGSRERAWSLTPGGAVAARPLPRERAALARGTAFAGPVGAALGAGAILVLLPLVIRGAAVRSPVLGATTETALTSTALIAAWLMRLRFIASRRLGDLLAVTAVSTLALISLGEDVLPAALGLRYGEQLAAARLWAPLSVGVAFAVAAFAGADRHVARPRRTAAAASGIPLAGVASALLAGSLLNPALTGAVRSGMPAKPLAHPLGLVVAAAGVGLLVAATIRMAVTSPRNDADRAPWTLPVSLALLAVAGAYQIAIGILPAGQMGVADVPRVLGFALLLVAAARHEPYARARVARAAALAERRRVARDLHDGLAQDLAFIATYAPTLAQELGDDHPVVLAAQRALTVSRGAISELADPARATARESLEAVAQELRERFDVAIAVDVALRTDLEPQGREQVTRIAREAMANAVRHGGARNISVSLRPLELAIVLRIVDDGCGLLDDGGVAAAEGFGVGSMRERAAALGGYLSVHQPHHGGTEVEVVFR